MGHVIRMLSAMLAMVGLVGALGASANATASRLTEAHVSYGAEAMAAAAPPPEEAMAVSTSLVFDNTAPGDLVPAESLTYEGGGAVIVPLVSEKQGPQLASVKGKCYGLQIRFNKAETAAIAAGIASCGRVIDKLPIPGTAKSVVKAACRVLSSVAAAAIGQGRCLAHNVYLIPPAIGGNPWTWDC